MLKFLNDHCTEQHGAQRFFSSMCTTSALLGGGSFKGGDSVCLLNSTSRLASASEADRPAPLNKGLIKIFLTSCSLL